MSTELSVNQIPAFIQKIDAQLASLKSMSDTTYKTTGKVDSFSVNLKDAKEVDTIIKMFSAVLGRKEMYDKAQTALEVKTAKQFTYNGHTVEEWKADCIFRIAVVTEHETRERLQKAKDKATTLLSDEDKKILAMKELIELLGEDTAK